MIYQRQTDCGGCGKETFTAGRRFRILLATLVIAGVGGLSVRATPVFHGISAANLMTNVTASLTINGFSLQSGSTASNYKVQINPTNAALDVSSGILISSIAENGIILGATNYGTNYGTTAVYGSPTTQGTVPGSTGTWTIANFGTVDDTNYPAYAYNVSAAYFPYAKGWFGGWLPNAGNTNNQATVAGGFLTNDLWYGNTNMVPGTNVLLAGITGGVLVDLRQFGLDSRSNAILLCCGGRDEENFAGSQANTNGTWTVTTLDDASGNPEADPNAFVCIPMTNHTVIAGRFNGCGSGWVAGYATSNCPIVMQNSPFFVTNTAVGTYHLVIPGVKPGQGVLIISAEQCTSTSINSDANDYNQDNIVSYQATADGWDIQTRDTGSGNHSPSLQGLPANESVASFVYIPAPTPGVTVAPMNSPVTTVSGRAASFSVTLDAPPVAEVDLANIAVSDLTAGMISTNLLVFNATNWSVPQMLTVTGVSNSVGVIQPYTLNFSPATSTDTNYNGLQPAAISLTNLPLPVASSMTVTESAGAAFKIAVANVATNWNDNYISLTGVNGTSTNGAAVTFDANYIYYPAGLTANDQINYSISDGFGGTNAGLINIVVGTNNVSGQTATITMSGGTALMNFAGIPNFTYYVQRSTDLSTWTTISTNPAPANGTFQFVDPNPPQPSAYYRLSGTP